MGKKYYAVRKGLNIGVYETWEECKKQVNGFKGAVFKSFPTRGEAEQFVGGNWEYHPSEGTVKAEMMPKKENNLASVPQNPPLTGNISFKRKATSSSSLGELDNLTDKPESYKENEANKAIAYVDGSYDIHTKEYSYGAVIFHNGEEHRFNQKFNNFTLNTMRNVAGEIEGSKKAMSFCVDNDIKHLDLYYDYEGIANWARGEWRTNKPGTIAYKNFYDEMVQKHQLKVKFIKVKAHSNNKYNDLADQLAKEALSTDSFDSTSKENTNSSNNKKIKFLS